MIHMTAESGVDCDAAETGIFIDLFFISKAFIDKNFHNELVSLFHSVITS